MNQKLAIGLVVVAILSFLAGSYLGRNKAKLGLKNTPAEARNDACYVYFNTWRNNSGTAYGSYWAQEYMDNCM